MSEANGAGELPRIHEHTHSVYTLCLECKSWGINLPGETRCGNCSAESGILYVPGCCVRAAYAAGRASRDGLREALENILEGGCDVSMWTWDVAKKALEADGEVK